MEDSDVYPIPIRYDSVCCAGDWIDLGSSTFGTCLGCYESIVCNTGSKKIREYCTLTILHTSIFHILSAHFHFPTHGDPIDTYERHDVYTIQRISQLDTPPSIAKNFVELLPS